jgi:hypothetical protein
MKSNAVLDALKRYTQWLVSVVHYLPYIALALGIILFIAIVLRVALRLWDWRQILRQKYESIEITPPITANKTPLQSTEWISRMHGIGSSRDKQEGLQRLHFTQSLELSSTNKGGIRYVTRVPEQELDLIKQSIGPHLNNARIRTVEDYLPSALNYKTARVLDFKQSAAYFLPLKTQESFQAHDPVGHLINAMNGLKDNEHIILQIVYVPTHLKENSIIEQRIRNNEDMLAHAKRHKGSPLFKVLVRLPLKVLSEIVMFITDVIYSSPPAGSTASSNSIREQPGRSLSPSTQGLNTAIGRKVSQPHHFRVEVRALIVTDDRKQAKVRGKAMRSAMSAYKTEHQSLRTRWNLPAFIFNRYRLFKFTHRLPSLIWHHSNKFSADEIADIYHFPIPGTFTENVVQNLSHTLPATLSQRRGADVDVVIGRNVHQEQHTDIGLTARVRMEHMYLIGSTGTGKTTLLESIIYQDMVNGKGLAVLDPHGDMYQKLLAIVPKHRKNDVVVFDPSDRDFPLGLSMLDPGIHFANKEDGYSRITSSVVYIFSKLADESFWGPRMEHILRSATLTALHLPNPSLYTLQRLLTDKRFQRETVKVLKDPVLKGFWLNEMLPLGGGQLATTVAPLTNRLGKFMTDTMARNILLQQHSTLRLSEIMNEGKILLVNLSKGDVGEDQSDFFGTILSSLIWMAAYQRTKIPEKKRRDFYLYIDEFQNFAAPGFKDIASEGRKFHIGLTVSHQNVAQIEDQNLLKIMAGNAHTIICFRASPSDEAFILPWMEPAVEKGNIVNLAPYHFFMKTVTDESELAFSGITVPLVCTESKKVSTRIIAASRKRYGTPRKDAEAYLDTMFANADNEPTDEPYTDETDSDEDEP